MRRKLAVLREVLGLRPDLEFLRLAAPYQPPEDAERMIQNLRNAGRHA